MKIDIFDVGHGACSVITCPDGKRLMVDCGSKKDPPYWWPSIQFYGETFAGLILTNLDEDHVDDFESTLKNLRVATVCINNTIDATRLKLLKPKGHASRCRDGPYLPAESFLPESSFEFAADYGQHVPSPIRHL